MLQNNLQGVAVFKNKKNPDDIRGFFFSFNQSFNTDRGGYSGTKRKRALYYYFFNQDTEKSGIIRLHLYENSYIVESTLAISSTQMNGFLLL